jgi:hypothetical protein
MKGVTMRIFALGLFLFTALAGCAPPLPIADYVADARSPNAKITTQPLRFDVITVRSFLARNRQERSGGALPYLHVRPAPIGRLSNPGASACATVYGQARAYPGVLPPAGH